MLQSTQSPVKVSVQIAQRYTSYDRQRQAWIEADELGADCIFNCDHFFPVGGDPDWINFECWTMLASMAEVIKRATIGVLVSGNSYRNRNLLADMSRTIDHISGGRFILGIGSGWFERDYVEYGYEFGTPGTRLRDLARDLPIMRDRLARLNPGPVNGSLPVMIGGSGEKVTLRLVAEHADIWHCLGSLEDVKRKAAVLDDWCQRVGRDPGEIERSAQVGHKDLPALGDYVAAGFTHLVTGGDGPEFDFSVLRKLIAWRDRQSTGTSHSIAEDR